MVVDWNGLDEWQKWALPLGVVFIGWVGRQVVRSFSQQSKEPRRKQVASPIQNASPMMTQTVYVHPHLNPIPFKTNLPTPEKIELEKAAKLSEKQDKQEKDLYALIVKMKRIHNNERGGCVERISLVVLQIKQFFDLYDELNTPYNSDLIDDFWSDEFLKRLDAFAGVYWRDRKIVAQDEDRIILNDPCRDLVETFVPRLLKLRVRQNRTMSDYEKSL